MANMSDKRFTGWHATQWLVGFFSVVIAVNLVMARLAGSTFGGEVVENSYVASQHFNRWLDEAAQSKKLGWEAKAHRISGGKLGVSLAGAPGGTALTAVARHPLGHRPDVALTFQAGDAGVFTSRETLPQGRWILRLEARHGADLWRAEEEIL